jgi:hypothetical protein
MLLSNDGRGVGVRILEGASFSPVHVVQTGSGDHLSSYPVATGDSFPGGKGARARPAFRLKLEPSSRISRPIHPLLVCTHGVVLNSLSTETLALSSHFWLFTLKCNY